MATYPNLIDDGFNNNKGVQLYVKPGDYIVTCFISNLGDPSSYPSYITVNNEQCNIWQQRNTGSSWYTYALYLWGPATTTGFATIKFDPKGLAGHCVFRVDSLPTFVTNVYNYNRNSSFSVDLPDSSLYYACVGNLNILNNAYNQSNLAMIKSTPSWRYKNTFFTFNPGSSGTVSIQTSSDSSGTFVVFNTALISCATPIPGPEYSDVVLSSISLSSLPTKTSYFVGETFDPTGLSVVAIYSDSSVVNLTSSDYTLSTPDMTTAGTKTITVSYDGQTTTFDITVTAIVCTSITLSGNYQTSFNVGDTFTSANLVVTAVYNNNTSATTNNFSVSAPDISTPGQKTVTVTYTGSDISDTAPTATYNITVISPDHPVIKYYDSKSHTFKSCEVYYITNSSISVNPYNFDLINNYYKQYWTVDELVYADREYSDYAGEIAFTYASIPAGSYYISYDYNYRYDYSAIDVKLAYKINDASNWTIVSSDDIITIPSDLTNATITFNFYVTITDWEEADEDEFEIEINPNPLGLNVANTTKCDVYYYDGTEFKKCEI